MTSWPISAMAASKKFYIAIDVGTQSVRAGLVTENGIVIKTHSSPIKTRNPYPQIYEQSSDEIWLACQNVIQHVHHGIDKKSVCGIGFDATCSLVAIGNDLKPASISKTGNKDNNIILWMDHRATEEARFITRLSDPNLKFTGGCMSPEMEPPKLLWLKKNFPTNWNDYKYFFELPDFLTWKATGSLTRSICSVVCKWMYVAKSDGTLNWNDNFFKSIGLEDLVTDGYKKIGAVVLPPGYPCGNGLLPEVAVYLGLEPGTPVATSIIDAHAGGIGVLSCKVPGRDIGILSNRMALISGTSACHMKVHEDPIATAGVWGPYYSAMIPGLWCVEAGQSAAGVLVDHVINGHPAAKHLAQSIGDDSHITDLLNQILENLREKFKVPSISYLTNDIHVWPDYHGNRSPLADSDLKGMVCGLSLSDDVESLAKQYLATIQALAYGTKHIISCLEEAGHVVSCLGICGGFSKNPVYVQMHADVTGLPVVVPSEPESVLVGSAILSSTAAHHSTVTERMAAMSCSGKLVQPNEHDKQYHEKKYTAFHKLLECQKAIREIMK